MLDDQQAGLKKLAGRDVYIYLECDLLFNLDGFMII